MVDFQKYIEESANLRQDVGQQIADAPAKAQAVREDVYGGEGALGSLREQRDDKIKALYDLDKRGADRYANPDSDMFIADPFARKKLMSGQHQQELGELQGVNRMIQSREDVLGSAVQRGLELMNAGLEAKKFEYSSLMDELGAALNIAKFEDSLSKGKASSTNWASLLGQIPGLSGDAGGEWKLKEGGTDMDWLGTVASLEDAPESIPTHTPAGGYGTTEGDWIWSKKEGEADPLLGILEALQGTDMGDEIGSSYVEKYIKDMFDKDSDELTKEQALNAAHNIVSQTTANQDGTFNTPDGVKHATVQDLAMYLLSSSKGALDYGDINEILIAKGYKDKYDD